MRRHLAKQETFWSNEIANSSHKEGKWKFSQYSAYISHIIQSSFWHQTHITRHIQPYDTLKLSTTFYVSFFLLLQEEKRTFNCLTYLRCLTSFSHQFQFWRLLVIAARSSVTKCYSVTIAARSSVTNVRLDKVGRLVLQRWNCNLKIMRFWSRCCQGGEREYGVPQLEISFATTSAKLWT